MKRSVFLLALGFCSSTVLSSCSLSDLGTTDALTGSLIGGAVGTGAGYVVGQEIGKTTENMALIGGIGAGLGGLTGGFFHNQRATSAAKRQVKVRQMAAIDQNQKQIDSLRNLQYEQSIWGQNENKPWDERYWGNEQYENGPYEGHLDH